METREQGPLRIEGTRAAVAAPGPVVCLRAEDAAGLEGVELFAFSDCPVLALRAWRR